VHTVSVQTQRAPVQNSHLYKGHRVSFQRVKRTRRGANHPLQTIFEVKERVELYIYASFGPFWAVLAWTSLFTDSKKAALLRVPSARHPSTSCRPSTEQLAVLRLSTSSISFCLTQNKMFPHCRVLYIDVFKNRSLFPELYENFSDSPRAGRCRDRIPVGVRFSAPFQTGSGVHTASWTKVTRSLSRG
jgi:hypothetical protein